MNRIHANLGCGPGRLVKRKTIDKNWAMIATGYGLLLVVMIMQIFGDLK